MTKRRTALWLLTAVSLLAFATVWGLQPRRFETSGETLRPSRASSGCGRCHAPGPPQGPGGAHAALSCDACHLGDPAGSLMLAAHRGLEREPGALDVVDRTCGRCHPAQVASVRTSPMATGRGIIEVDRLAFGEAPEPGDAATFAELLRVAAPSSAEDHLRRLCAGCHLGTRRDNRDDALRGSGSGCAACHAAPRRGEPAAGSTHPALGAHVPTQRCLGCHSRSARISLSYQGQAEVQGPPRAGCSQPISLFDGRAGCQLSADLHYAAGMECVDCHVHNELMGDGHAHARAERALQVRCESCHGPVAPSEQTTWAQISDPVTRAVLRQRGEQRPANEPVRVGRGGTALWNLRPGTAGGWTLQRKADGKRLSVPATPLDRDHRQPGHERLTCTACHAAWTPRCPSCHSAFDPSGEQWDFGRARMAQGAWVERNEGMGWSAPVLGISARGQIVAGTYAMHATLLDKQGFTHTLRRFVALDPHTSSKARACGACHYLEAAAPGAQVALDRAQYVRAAALPEFRGALKPFETDALRRVAQVALCLPCHTADSAIYENFSRAAARRAARCKLPP